MIRHVIFLTAVALFAATPAYAGLGDKVPSVTRMWGEVAVIGLVAVILGLKRSWAPLLLIPIGLLSFSGMASMLSGDFGERVMSSMGADYVRTAWLTAGLNVAVPAMVAFGFAVLQWGKSARPS